VEAAGRAAEVAAEVEKLLVGLLDEAERRVAAPSRSDPAPSSAGDATGRAASDTAPPGSSSVLSVRALLGLETPVRRLLLHRWLERQAPRLPKSDLPPTGRAPARPRVSRASVLALESLLHGPGSAERSLGGGWGGVKQYDELSLVYGRADLPPAPPPVGLSVPGCAVWGDVWVQAAPADRFRAPDVAREAFVDARSMAGVLEVRGPRPGDRVHPLGAPGTRKLHDLLVDLRVPAATRPRTPLLVCNGRVLWVCGLVIAEEGRITRDTSGIVRLSLGRVCHETGGRHETGTY
jgi:tRNA(Ile)-lysidine synthetase-like protein